MKKLVTALIVAVTSADAKYAPQIPVESVPDFFRLPTGVKPGIASSVTTAPASTTSSRRELLGENPVLGGKRVFMDRLG